MIVAYIIIAAFAALMLAGTITAVFHGGEKEGICKYDHDNTET